MKVWKCLECGARWFGTYKQHCHGCNGFKVEEEKENE